MTTYRYGRYRWGLGYIRDRYGNPCGAWASELANGWY